jgi:hypothetical protein
MDTLQEQAESYYGGGLASLGPNTGAKLCVQDAQITGAKLRVDAL